jgi:hypothetical protein
VSRGGGAPTKRIGRSFLGPFFPLLRSDFFFFGPSRVEEKALFSVFFSLLSFETRSSFRISPVGSFFRKKDLCGAIVAFLSLSLSLFCACLGMKLTSLSFHAGMKKNI